MKKTKIFFDTEFSGLHKGTTLISIGFISETGQTFYAELTDYDTGQIDSWLKENIIDRLTLLDQIEGFIRYENGSVVMKGRHFHLKNELKQWFQQFEFVELWSIVFLMTGFYLTIFLVTHSKFPRIFIISPWIFVQ